MMIFDFVPYCIYTSWLITLTFGIINTLIYSICLYYVYQFLFFNGHYFFVICKYFIIKINNLNDILKALQGSQRLNNRIHPILRSLNNLYYEINVYNKFWSKYLFIIWLIFGEVVILLLYMVTFVPLQIAMLLVFIYCIIFGVIFLGFIFSLPSSVNYNVNKSYKLFNSLIITINKLSQIQRNKKLKISIKVNLIIKE